MTRLLRDRRVLLSLGWLLGIIALGVLAPLIAPYSPTAQSLGDTFAPPDARHLLGTDDLGRDVFTRLVYGTPLALYSSVLAVTVTVAIVVPLGLVAGFAGGWVDVLVGRLINTMLSFPVIILAIAITGALSSGLVHSMVVVGVVFSPIMARLVRGQTLVLREELFVDAARCFGASTQRCATHSTRRRFVAGDNHPNRSRSKAAAGAGKPVGRAAPAGHSRRPGRASDPADSRSRAAPSTQSNASGSHGWQ